MGLKKIEQELQVAKDAALKSGYTNSQGRYIKMAAAVFTKKGYCVATSTNQKKTHYLQAYYNANMPFTRIPYLHAEIAALLKARWQVGEQGLKGCTLYVARKLNCNGYGMARPCAACRAAMIDMGIKQVVYTTDNGFAVEHLKGENV